MQVKKAVIPAAGYGTRMLPLTKALPKEFVPIVDKPSIQFLVEEAAASGIEDVLIIVSRGKELIESHFDRCPELETKLEKGGKAKQLEQILGIAGLANIFFIRQPEMRGTGAAIHLARPFTGTEPFAVLYGDDVIVGQPPATLQLMRAYEKYGLGVVGMNEVAKERISSYSSLRVERLEDRNYKVTDMNEKPAPGEEFSLFSIQGRLVLPPEIYGIIENTPAGAGGEIQITDAMKTLARAAGMTGVDFIGERYDMGNKFDVARAYVEQAAAHPEIGEQFRAFVREFAAQL